MLLLVKPATAITSNNIFQAATATTSKSCYCWLSSTLFVAFAGCCSTTSNSNANYSVLVKDPLINPKPKKKEILKEVDLVGVKYPVVIFDLLFEIFNSNSNLTYSNYLLASCLESCLSLTPFWSNTPITKTLILTT